MSGEVRARPHLSIGEVLSLLQHEFPDITISKIRFLESQGLLDPERTPSGYRKFYEPDIERLRWILSQQRDHFLPLKVIKERLAATAGDRLPDDDPGSYAGAGEADDDAVDGREGADAALLDRRTAGSAPAPSSSSPPSPAAAAPAPAPRNDRAFAPARGPAAPAAAAPAPRSAAAPAARADATTAVRPVPATATAGDAVGRRAGLPVFEAPTLPSSAAAGARGVDRASLAEALARRAAERAAASGNPLPAPLAARGPALDPHGDDVSITRAELAAASGLSERDIETLEGFGLLAGQSVGREMVFDTDALVIARLAAAFAQHGLEPRHLRMFKVAADREAGVYEQLTGPLLRQRSPDVRREATERIHDLSRMGQELQAVLVRSALRHLLA